MADEAMLTPIHADFIYHEGRGPILGKAHYGPKGIPLKAIDFFNPDEKDVKHLLFIGSQVFMFTPEEVWNYAAWTSIPTTVGNAALFSLGRSAWLASFAPQHLARCSHYRAMFYDEFLDVICEGVEVRAGRYRAD